jgi:hypothetical protein
VTQVNCASVLEQQPALETDPAVEIRSLTATYPSAPALLFEAPWRFEPWHRMLLIEPPGFWIEPNDGKHKCHCTFIVPGGDEHKVSFSAISKRQAARGAHQRLVLELHRNGTLQTMISDPQELATKAKQTRKEQFKYGTKLLKNMYEYCASCLLSPSFSFENSEDTWHRTATIRLPDDNDRLLGAGRSTSGPDSVISALLSFDRAIKSLPKLDASRLTFENSAKFVAFCHLEALGDGRLELRWKHGVSVDINVRADLVVKIQAHHFGMLVRCYLHGKIIGQPAFVFEKQDANDVAILSAAIHLAKERPEMWKAFAAKLHMVPEKFVSHAEDGVVASRSAVHTSTGDIVPGSKPVDQISTSSAASNAVAIPNNSLQNLRQEILGAMGTRSSTEDRLDKKETKKTLNLSEETEQNPENGEMSNLPEEKEKNTKKKKKAKKARVVPSVEVLTTPDMSALMLSASRDMLQVPEGGAGELALPDGSLYGGSDIWKIRQPGRRLDSRSRQLQVKHSQLRQRVTKLQEKIDSLPINQFRQRQEICSMVKQNTYSIVVGSTGSGKALPSRPVYAHADF